jgi:hypothetical protein
MTRTVKIKVGLQMKSFPADTNIAGNDFEYHISSDNHSEGKSSPTAECIFTSVPAGSYTVTVSRLGTAKSAPFTVPGDDILIGVPDIIEVEITA